MKTAAIILSATTLLILGACSTSEEEQAAGSVPGEEQSVEEVAGEMEKVSIMPGQWETTSEIVDVTIEGAPQGMPANMADMMKGRKTVSKNCITPEQAANPSAEMLNDQKNNSCTYSNFSLSGGLVKGNVSCPAGDGGTATVALNGSYAPDSYVMTMKVDAAGMGSGGPAGMKMMMTMQTTGKHIGDCPG